MSARERTVHFAQDGALGTITLDSPPMNLIGEELIADLSAAISKVEAGSGLRALLLRGEGDVFSAGANVKLFAGRGCAEMRPLVESFLDLGRRIEDLPLPTLAAVHGTCMAGGFELALFCDLIWAAEGTVLGLPETSLGIVPLAGGVERVAARAGLGRARTIALGGGLHNAEDFAAWGAIDRVLAADELHAKAEKFARRLADGPTRAYAVVKDLVRAYTDGGIARADALLLDAAVGLFDTDDARGGIQTFLDSGPGKMKFLGR
ncbi:MAG TPA: enoyl-CoA hydratase/isomerase family protein [Solirubrobacteraceae bacterium]|jgi:enoyl-CoA hydratase/carnithine racemase|nr:enoyl-CoA hydratase/isomerase family protein [Solirubrobacteraceae bacterium]